MQLVIKIAVFLSIVIAIALIVYFYFKKSTVLPPQGCDPQCTAGYHCDNGNCLPDSCDCTGDQVCCETEHICRLPCGKKPDSDTCKNGTYKCDVGNCDSGTWTCESNCGAYPSTSGECKTFSDLECDGTEWVCRKGCNNKGVDRLKGKGCECTDSYGDKCQYNLPECNNHGTYNKDTDSCVCSATDSCGEAWDGKFCDVSSDTKCNGLKHQGCWNKEKQSCVCKNGFSGADCSHTINNCNGHGHDDGSGNCICEFGFLGSQCQYQNSDCNGGNAKVDKEDKLICDCTSIHSAGDRCQFTPVKNCHNHGTPQADSTGKTFTGCLCDTLNGYKSSSTCVKDGTCCQCSDFINCNGHGDSIPTIGGTTCSCSCDDSRKGLNCQCDKNPPAKLSCNLCDDFQEPMCKDDGTCENRKGNEDPNGCYNCETATTCPNLVDLFNECPKVCSQSNARQPICDFVNKKITCQNTCTTPDKDEALKCSLDKSCANGGTGCAHEYICNGVETNWVWQCREQKDYTTICPSSSYSQPACLTFVPDPNNPNGGSYEVDKNFLASPQTYKPYCDPGKNTPEGCTHDGSGTNYCSWYCEGSPQNFSMLADRSNLNPNPVSINSVDHTSQEKVWFKQSAGLPVFPVVNNEMCVNKITPRDGLSDVFGYGLLWPDGHIPEGHLLASSNPNDNGFVFLKYDPDKNYYYDFELQQ